MANKTEKLQAQLKEIKAKIKEAKKREKAAEQLAILKKVKASGLSLADLDRLLAVKDESAKHE